MHDGTGPKSTGQVRNAIKIEPTRSPESTHGDFQQTYAFEGRTKEYIVTLHYLNHSLLKVELKAFALLRF
ncbi:hypothetical protein [Pseudobythopirellula maris]|nr:hypothetical protein [Pseudobythopirellula maris]